MLEPGRLRTPTSRSHERPSCHRFIDILGFSIMQNSRGGAYPPVRIFAVQCFFQNIECFFNRLRIHPDRRVHSPTIENRSGIMNVLKNPAPKAIPVLAALFKNTGRNCSKLRRPIRTCLPSDRAMITNGSPGSTDSSISSAGESINADIGVDIACSKSLL
jgi:hypothetical protein